MKQLITLITIVLFNTQCNKPQEPVKGDTCIIVTITADSTLIDNKPFIRVITNKGELYLTQLKTWVIGDTLQLQ